MGLRPAIGQEPRPNFRPRDILKAVSRCPPITNNVGGPTSFQLRSSSKRPLGLPRNRSKASDERINCAVAPQMASFGPIMRGQYAARFPPGLIPQRAAVLARIGTAGER